MNRSNSSVTRLSIKLSECSFSDAADEHDRGACPIFPPPAVAADERTSGGEGGRCRTDPALEVAEVFVRDEEGRREIIAERALPLLDGHVLDQDVDRQGRAVVDHRYFHLAPRILLLARRRTGGEEQCSDLFLVRQIWLHSAETCVVDPCLELDESSGARAVMCGHACAVFCVDGQRFISRCMGGKDS